MFKYKEDWYNMTDYNVWNAIEDYYNKEIFIRGGQIEIPKGDKVRIGEAFIIDEKYGVINLATIDLSWVIEEVMGCEIE